MEMSYLDLLYKLREDVESGAINTKDKRKIIKLIHKLGNILWKYSY